jgi:hypothetical protein
MKGVKNMIEQDTIRLLRECDEGVKMGISSIEDVLSRVRSDTLEKRLTDCKTEHEALSRELQQLLDRAGFRIDYIHGEDAVRGLVRDENAVGLLVPGIDKHTLFPAVRDNGPLPRKCFSMGEAHEKRFYIEAQQVLD